MHLGLPNTGVSHHAWPHLVISKHVLGALFPCRLLLDIPAIVARLPEQVWTEGAPPSHRAMVDVPSHYDAKGGKRVLMGSSHQDRSPSSVTNEGRF